MIIVVLLYLCNKPVSSVYDPSTPQTYHCTLLDIATVVQYNNVHMYIVMVCMIDAG